MRLTALRIVGLTKGGRDARGDESELFDFKLLRKHFKWGN